LRELRCIANLRASRSSLIHRRSLAPTAKSQSLPLPKSASIAIETCVPEKLLEQERDAVMLVLSVWDVLDLTVWFRPMRHFHVLLTPNEG
jgi:hypothetical protein